ncbi:MAG: hypothetical protein EON60_09820 [Alphaproteobacteria bacterium]|nr:MAG: hypothetical protein EON60_09820 [Alphaproteobacteria bacterium]
MTILVPHKPDWLPVTVDDYHDMRFFAVLAVVALAWLIVVLLSPWAVRVCRRFNMVSAVTERSSHINPTPHGGGFILPLVVVPLLLAVTWVWPLPFKGYLSVLALGSLLVAYVGWLDDRHELSASTRLLVHLFAVAIPLLLLPRMFDFMPLGIEKTILLLGWAWFVSLYNFMDGADGLATSQAVAMGLGLAIFVPVVAPAGLLVAAAAAGFLRVNGPPAKVFMGDVCATWLGYLLAGLFLLGVIDDTVNIVWPLATLALVFAADATTTLARRISQGHKPWQPHKTFWFHRYMALGRTHAQLVTRVALLNATLFVCAWFGYQSPYPATGFLLGMLVIFAAAWYIRAGEKARRNG